MTDLGLDGSETTDEIERRKKRLMAAGTGDTTGLARFGSAAFALLGPQGSRY